MEIFIYLYVTAAIVCLAVTIPAIVAADDTAEFSAIDLIKISAWISLTLAPLRWVIWPDTRI